MLKNVGPFAFVEYVVYNDAYGPILLNVSIMLLFHFFFYFDFTMRTSSYYQSPFCDHLHDHIES